MPDITIDDPRFDALRERVVLALQRLAGPTHEPAMPAGRSSVSTPVRTAGLTAAETIDA